MGGDAGQCGDTWCICMSPSWVPAIMAGAQVGVGAGLQAGPRLEGLGDCHVSAWVSRAAVGSGDSGRTYLQLAQVGSPGPVHEALPVFLCKETEVGNEGRDEQNVSTQRVFLLLEVLHSFCPPHIFRSESSHLRFQRPERREGLSQSRRRSPAAHSARFPAECPEHRCHGPSDPEGLQQASQQTSPCPCCVLCAVSCELCGQWIDGRP